jgi:Helix-turn-helix domain
LSPHARTDGRARASAPRARDPTPRLALSVTEAAEALGVSVDFFHEHIAPELRVVRRGRRKLYAVREIDRWLDASAARTLE